MKKSLQLALIGSGVAVLLVASFAFLGVVPKAQASASAQGSPQGTCFANVNTDVPITVQAGASTTISVAGSMKVGLAVDGEDDYYSISGESLNSAGFTTGGEQTYSLINGAQTNPQIMSVVGVSPGTYLFQGDFSGEQYDGTIHEDDICSVSATDTVIVTPAPAPIVVKATCSPTTVVSGGTSTCTATVTGTSTTAVNWTTTAPGTISATGVYTANGGLGNPTVKATSQADPTKSSSVGLTVVAPPPTVTSITVACFPTAIYTGATSTSNCTATVTGTNSPNTGVTWTLPTGPGVLTPSSPTVAVYTASGGAGNPVIKATSIQDATKSATTTIAVTVQPPPSPTSTITSVTVVCNPTSTPINGNSTCNATVAGTGSYSQTVIWTTSSGSISTSGIFTAGGAAGTATITATSKQDPTQSGSAPVVVTAPPPPPPGTGTVVVQSTDASTGQPVVTSWSFTYPTIDPCTLAPCTGVSGGTYSGVPVGNYSVNVPSTIPNPAGGTYNLDPASVLDQIVATGTTINLTIEWDAVAATSSPTSTTPLAINPNPPPATQVNQPVNVTATGGSGGGYTWSAPGATIPSGSGSTYGPTYPTIGMYTITVTDSGGSATTTAVIITPPLGVTPDPVPPTPVGNPVTFTATGGTGGGYTWSAPGASNPTGSGSIFSPSYPTSGTYTITVTDSGGDTAPVTVTIIQPSCTFTPSPATVIPPQTSTLSWSCMNAVSCTVNGVATASTLDPSTGVLSGSTPEEPSQTSVYTLQCIGSGSNPGLDSAQATATVKVSGPGLHEGN